MNNFYTLVAIISLLDLAAIVSAKFWVISKNNLYLTLTVLLCATAGFFFARSLQFEGIAITNIIWGALSSILVTAAGYFIFREIITPWQFVAMAIILVGLVMINWR
ncbi:MAG: hypothetical protein PHW95_02725 [Patescibacteria group bacterium]|nr:hypothetical protein [Patescibacteria group bacterium]